MKVTKKVEAEIRGVYGAFWDSYLSGDVKTMGSFLSDDFTLIGTSDGEVFNNKKSAIKYLKATIHQIAGVLSRKNIEIKVTQVNDTVLVNEFSDAYISPDGTPSFYDKFRATVIMKRVRGKWKFIHQHGSLPDSKAEVGETLAAEKIRKENRELREAVKRRTRELEETNRDLEIEASLEKVRARAMAMQSSSELADLIGMIYTELTRLDITLDRCFIMLFDEPSGDAVWWMASGETTSLKRGYHIPFHKHAPHLAYLKGWKNQASTWKYVLKGEVKKKWDTFIFTNTELAHLPREIIKNMKVWTVAHLSASFNKYGCITSGTFTPLETTSLNLLTRFSRMFEQTYTRFLDLKKAETQVREAQIEAALERVRSRTMAMHKSDELLDVITVVSVELQHVGIKFNTVSFGKNSSSFDMDFWVAAPDLKVPLKIHAPYSNISIYRRLKEAYRERRNYFSDTFTAEETKVWNQHVIDHNPESFSQKSRGYLTSRPGMSRSTILLKNIFLFLINYDFVSYSNEEIEIVIRFANVFEQTYTRFLDLQKAEALAREAQIELGLERVRARAMAMHHSGELKDVVAIMFDKLKELNVVLGTIAIQLFDQNTMNSTFWAGNNLHQEPPKVKLPYDEKVMQDGYMKDCWEFKKKGENIINKEYTFEQKTRFFDYVFANNDLTIITEAGRDVIRQAVISPPNDYIVCLINEENSSVFADSWNGQFYSEESIRVLIKATKVFEQAYVRFLDLQKAEAQARESQIEAALERVRSRTMAMNKSEQLGDTAALMFEQLRVLGITLWSAGFNIWNEDNLSYVDWMANPGGGFIEPYVLDLTSHQDFINLSNARKSGMDFYVFEQSGARIEECYRMLNGDGEYQKILDSGFQFPKHQVCHFVFGAKVSLLFISFEPCPEYWDIFKRFGKVFEQTYTRFLDLQKAEAHAREAISQASLDRVRAEIASMRTIEDLDRITPLIWRELRAIGIPFIRCGVFIMDESNREVHSFLSTPDGKAIAVFQLPFDVPGFVEGIVKHWQDKKMYLNYWDEVAKRDFAEMLVNQGIFASTQQYFDILPKEGFHLHFLPFAQGMLYVGNLTQLKNEELILLQSLADAFATAYARYDDFSKLESAKQQVDKTLVNLKQAQQQLVQSEKMASLGELTAGIAHEIQNPLNFVNNFSDVSNELIEEMKTELKAGNLEGAREFAESIKQNLEKIAHHGRRADGIVKGMLQHSRAGSGQKEPTDLNLLCDEYLRLTYHGYRAKEKSFNAKFQSDFDPTLPKIILVPQDIGRVFLNLINNAFYAVTEMRKHNNDGYEAMVTVITKHLSGKVEITIKDNGIGMPEKVKEKIFQPFFTTKPTGQGTGLGLSLSYDIIKAHGGTLEVKSKQGEGSEFIIQLPT